MNDHKFTTVEEYIAQFSDASVRDILNKIRVLIAENAPEAVECIAYNMPAYKLHKKPLVYYAGYAHHIGFYALPSGNVEFQKALSQYKTGKGSIQFPLDREMPYDLIKQIVLFRVAEENEKRMVKK